MEFLVADVGETVSQLGLAALIAAVVAAWFAASRDRVAAEREWLRSSLEAFYTPITAKLEFEFMASRAHLEDKDRRKKSHEETLARITEKYVSKGLEVNEAELRNHRVSYQNVMDGLTRQWMKATTQTHREIADLIEANLHYVDSTEVRRQALQYVKNTRMTEWEHHATNLDLETVSPLLIITKEQRAAMEERRPFHRLMLSEFDMRAKEFRRLSNRRGAFRRRRRSDGRERRD